MKLLESMGNRCGKVSSLACMWPRSRLQGNELSTQLNTSLSNELNSNLWARLPRSLEGEILARLHISSLSPSCRVCKRWRDLILFSKVCPRFRSAHGHLIYFSSDRRLFAFSSSRGTWDRISLQFLPPKPFSLRELVMSEGGLLCFRTSEDGVFIVCNPLTKWYRRLQVPCGKASKVADQPFIPTPERNCWSFSSSKVVLLVGIVVDSETGHFKLIVGGRHPGSQGTTLVYDSRADSWKKVGHIPDSTLLPMNGFHWRRGSVQIPPVIEKLACGGNMYFHFEYCGWIQLLVKYDVKREVWTLVNVLFCGFPNAVNSSCNNGSCNIIQHNGKVLVVIPTEPLAHQVTCEVWELQYAGTESRGRRWTSVNHLPFSKVLGLINNHTRVTCLGQGNAKFYITRSTDLFPWWRNPSTITEWFHDVSTSSDVISNWQYSSRELDHHEKDIHIFTWSTGAMHNSQGTLENVVDYS